MDDIYLPPNYFSALQAPVNPLPIIRMGTLYFRGRQIHVCITKQLAHDWNAMYRWGAPSPEPFHVVMDDGGEVPYPYENLPATGLCLIEGTGAIYPRAADRGQQAAVGRQAMMPLPAQHQLAPVAAAPSPSDSGFHSGHSTRRSSHASDPIVIPDDDEELAPVPAQTLTPPPPEPKEPSHLKERIHYLSTLIRVNPGYLRWWTSFMGALPRHQKEYCRQYWPTNEKARADLEYVTNLWVDFDKTRLYRKGHDALEENPILHKVGGDQVVDFEAYMKADAQRLAEEKMVEINHMNGFESRKRKMDREDRKADKEKKRRIADREPAQRLPTPPATAQDLVDEDDGMEAAILQAFEVQRSQPPDSVNGPMTGQDPVEEDDGMEAAMFQEFEVQRSEPQESIYGRMESQDSADDVAAAMWQEFEKEFLEPQESDDTPMSGQDSADDAVAAFWQELNKQQSQPQESDDGPMTEQDLADFCAAATEGMAGWEKDLWSDGEEESSDDED